MFGLFKKPDTRQTTRECLEVWGILSERDKASSAKNIMAYAAGLAEQSKAKTPLPHLAILVPSSKTSSVNLGSGTMSTLR